MLVHFIDSGHRRHGPGPKALDVEKALPDAGEPGAAPADPAMVNNVVTYIYGHGNAVAVDSSNGVQLAGVHDGDLDGLVRAVADAGLEPNEIAELEDAIKGYEADRETPPGQPGSRVRQFLGKAALGSLKMVGEEAVREGGKLVGDLVRAYYGIH
ncbi:hypothetical protein A5782_05615 [Mycobacterium sp. 852002-40037_SCH5390672]|nr:hypothetical protein A5782_05615 [Mycobacterium sp. 852002-40037_SCH5390672]